MDFGVKIITPASTLASLPKVTNLEVMKGVIVQWYIFFPQGHYGECEIRVRKGAEPLLPRNAEGFIFGNGTVYKSPDFIYLSHAPYKLQIFTWNRDTVNQHELLITLSILPLWTFTPFSHQMFDLIEQEELFKVI